MMPWLMVFHLLGLVFWVGALLLLTKLLLAHSQETEPQTRHTLANLAKGLLRGWAHPGAAIMVVTGILLIYTNPSYYLRAGWLHMKLLLVVVLLGLHFWIFVRARAVAAGRGEFPRSAAATLHGGIVLIFLLILVLVFVKPFGP